MVKRFLRAGSSNANKSVAAPSRGRAVFVGTSNRFRIHHMCTRSIYPFSLLWKFYTESHQLDTIFVISHTNYEQTTYGNKRTIMTVTNMNAKNSTIKNNTTRIKLSHYFVLLKWSHESFFFVHLCVSCVYLILYARIWVWILLYNTIKY